MAQYGGNGGGYGQQSRYGQQAGNPYQQVGSSDGGRGGGNPYAQQQAPNPYAQQQQAPNPYAQQGGRGGAPPGNYSANDVEMGTMEGGGAGYGQPAAPDPHAILNECRDVDRGIDSIQRNLDRLQYLQQQSLDDPDASQATKTNRELDQLSTDTMTMYRSFTTRVKKIKGMPGAGSEQNAAQVGRVERKLKDAIQKYQQVDAEFRKKLQAQLARQYRIVRPEASEAEVREACEDTSSTQVFSQALIQSDRRGQSQSALRAVQGRHEAIQKIESQVIELAQLFNDMNALVVSQEPVVTRIAEQSANVEQDVTGANVHLDTAVKSARAARKKKWICLGIVVLILVIIAAALAAYFATRPKASAKTSRRV